MKETSYEEAMAVVDQVIEENPFSPDWKYKYQVVELNDKQYEVISGYFNDTIEKEVVIYETEPRMKFHAIDGGVYHL